jgi:hypothetical protein
MRPGKARSTELGFQEGGHSDASDTWNQVEGMGPAGEERGIEVAVKGGKAPAVFHRETEQVELASRR